MKKLFVILFAMCLVAMACKEKNVTSEQSERKTHVGKIISIPNPCTTIPCLPGNVLALETTFGDYVLYYKHWFIDKIIVENVEFFVDDEVEITGITTVKQDINSNKYTELEIKTIKQNQR
jgi:hypothetical protein